MALFDYLLIALVLLIALALIARFTNSGSTQWKLMGGAIGAALLGGYFIHAKRQRAKKEIENQNARFEKIKKDVEKRNAIIRQESQKIEQLEKERQALLNASTGTMEEIQAISQRIDSKKREHAILNMEIEKEREVLEEQLSAYDEREALPTMDAIKLARYREESPLLDPNPKQHEIVVDGHVMKGDIE